MSAYLITGSPGVGKSTVTLALKERGFQAYDSESMPDVTRLEFKSTGQPADWPPEPIDWDRYAFNWQESGLLKLLDDEGPVFVGASVSNMANYYHLFDKIFVLSLDNRALKERLLTRDKNYGKHPDELAGILNYNTERQAKLALAPHATVIDASRPLHEVVDDILSQTKDTSK